MTLKYGAGVLLVFLLMLEFTTAAAPGIAGSRLLKMSRWVNWWWRAIEMSPDNRQMNPGETKQLLTKSPPGRNNYLFNFFMTAQDC